MEANHEERRESDGSVSGLMSNENVSYDETSSLFGEEHKRHLLSTTPPARDHDKLRKRLTFAAFALTYFTMTASYSVIAPFYPTEAKAKGASGNEIGLIFGIFALATFVFSPIAGILVPILGIRFLLFTGIFVAGVVEFLFGFLNKMPDGTVFIVYSMVLRAVDGIGGAASMTAAVACLAQCFPDNVSTVMGALELFTGVGLTVGPLIGGVLYQYGGFGMPFFVLSGLMLASLPFIACILPSSVRQGEAPSNTDRTSDVSMMSFLKIPAFLITINTTIIGGMAIGIVEPVLAIHLKNEFNITNSTKVGFIFFMLCGSYALSAPFAGWLADKTNGRVLMTVGCFVLSVGFFLLGPVPVSFMHSSLTQVYISMLVIGSSLGPFFTPAISDMENIARVRGFPDDLTTHGLISGIFGAAFNVGAFVGPTCSGIIMEHTSFTMLCTGFGVLVLIQAFFLLGLTISKSDAKPSYWLASNYKVFQYGRDIGFEVKRRLM